MNTKKRNLPVGYDNFRSVIESDLLFVDKSLFIKEFLDDSASQVTLIPRPRRFGKTLNLSMLHHFFAPNVDGKTTEGLFDSLKITRAGDTYMAHQGQYPVIFLSFKDIKAATYQSAFANLQRLMSNVYQEHIDVLDNPRLTSKQKYDFDAILAHKANEAQLKSALFDLTSCLYRHTSKKVMVLIDEYDTPIQSGYAQGYYPQIVELMRHLLGASLKSNPYLNRALLTGIMRISKESLFSELNNLKVYSFFGTRYSEEFGFTEQEVNDLAAQTGLSDKVDAMRAWYNGYRIDGVTLYNPWSIANCIQESGALRPYWVNTSDNQLVKELIIQSSSDFKTAFENLLAGKPIKHFINEDFVFENLKTDEELVWSLLLLTGYLKIDAFEERDQGLYCTLSIPNQEVRNLYRRLIEQWLSRGKGLVWYNNFLNCLLKHTLSTPF